MPTLLARLSHLKAPQGMTATTDDAAYLRALADASDYIENECQRTFAAVTATRYFQRIKPTNPHLLHLDDDVISLSSVTVDANDDGTYELTLAEGTDFWLENRWATDEGPYRTLELISRSTVLSEWPRHRRAVKLTGVFGFSDDTEAAGTLGAAISDAAATSITMTAGHGIDAGETIVIGSEQLYVSAVSTNTLTVVRGVNGTTAATALINAAVQRRVYPETIRYATLLEATRYIWNAQTGQAGAVYNSEGTSGFVTAPDLYPQPFRKVSAYKRGGHAPSMVAL